MWYGFHIIFSRYDHQNFYHLPYSVEDEDTQQGKTARHIGWTKLEKRWTVKGLLIWRKQISNGFFSFWTFLKTIWNCQFYFFHVIIEDKKKGKHFSIEFFYEFHHGLPRFMLIEPSSAYFFMFCTDFRSIFYFKYIAVKIRFKLILVIIRLF